jgi:hypothetical protein
MRADWPLQDVELLQGGEAHSATSWEDKIDDRHDRPIRMWLPVRRGALCGNWSTERSLLVPLPKLSQA